MSRSLMIGRNHFLSYYYDHQAEFDSEIERQLKEYDELWAKAEDSPLRQRLRAMSKLP